MFDKNSTVPHCTTVLQHDVTWYEMKTLTKKIRFNKFKMFASVQRMKLARTRVLRDFDLLQSTHRDLNNWKTSLLKSKQIRYALVSVVAVEPLNLRCT